MKLVILTEGKLDLEAHEITKEATVESVHVGNFEDELVRWKDELAKVRELVVVGFDGENIAGLIFAGMAEGGEALAELLGFEDGKMPEMSMSLRRDMPELATGDIVVCPLVGGHFSVIRVNYRPTYTLERLSSSILGGMKLKEQCYVQAPCGEVKVTPCGHDWTRFFVNFQDGRRPYMVDGVHSVIAGWAAVARERNKQTNSAPTFQSSDMEEAYYTAVGRVKRIWDMIADERKVGTSVNREFAFDALTDIWKRGAADDDAACLEEAIADFFKLWTEENAGTGGKLDNTERIVVAKAIFSAVANLSDYKYPYDIVFWRGTTWGLVADLKEAIEAWGYSPHAQIKLAKPKKAKKK